MNKFIAILVLMSISIFAFMICLEPQQQMLNTTEDVALSQILKTSSTQMPKISSRERISQQQTPRLFKIISDSELKQKYNLPKYLQEKSSPNATYVIFDHNALNHAKVGDQFDFKMLSFGINREAIISSVEKIDDGIVRWTGHFKGHPSDISYFTITQAATDYYAIMKVFTENCFYLSEINDGIGLMILEHKKKPSP
jgi:hypothetical protein